jgi:hypothetical protein
MSDSIEFTGCKDLDFGDNYTAQKNLFGCFGETKVCWDRPVPDESYPHLVQFCKRRGRRNHPEQCLSEETKGCNDYEETQHTVDLATVAI